MTINCPDREVCTHSCDFNAAGRCFRIRLGYAPRLGIYLDNKWPAEVRREHAPEHCQIYSPHGEHDACPGRELIEDVDSAPLPPELQRDGAVWRAVRRGLNSTEAWTPRFRDLRSDEIAQHLAPVLWPWLPSND